MNSTSSCRPRHRRWKITIAMLAASAAFVGGQALAPTPAVAMFSNGPGACQFWIDCITQEETGGGGGGGAVTPGGGSAAPGGGDIEANPETIVVETECQRPNVVCIPIPVGGRGGGDPQIDKDGRRPHGEVGKGNGRRPQCKPKAGNPDACPPKKDKGKEEPKAPKEEPKPKTAVEEALEHGRWCRGLKETTKATERTIRKVEAAGGQKAYLEKLREVVEMNKQIYELECTFNA